MSNGVPAYKITSVVDDQAEPRVHLGLARDRLGAAHLSRHPAAEVLAQDDPRVEHRDERFEVPLTGRGEKRVDHLALTLDVRVGDGALALHPPAPALQHLAQRMELPQFALDIFRRAAGAFQQTLQKSRAAL